MSEWHLAWIGEGNGLGDVVRTSELVQDLGRAGDERTSPRKSRSDTVLVASDERLHGAMRDGLFSQPRHGVRRRLPLQLRVGSPGARGRASPPPN
eukprot:3171968-Prymnesium_polylepis.1